MKKPAPYQGANFMCEFYLVTVFVRTASPTIPLSESTKASVLDVASVGML